MEDPSACRARGSLLLPACPAAQKRFFDLGLIERSLPTSRRKGDLIALSDEHDLCSVRGRPMNARGGKYDIVVFGFSVTVVDKSGFEAVSPAVDILVGEPEAATGTGPPIRILVDLGESVFDGRLGVEAGRGQIV